MTAPPASPRLRRAIVLRVQEDSCQVTAGGEVVSVSYAAQFPSPRMERVSPGHLVAVAELPGRPAIVVWRWHDAVVIGIEAGSVLPGAEWWVAGQAVDRAENADVELDEVERLYTEHDMWDSAFGL